MSRHISAKACIAAGAVVAAAGAVLLYKRWTHSHVEQATSGLGLDVDCAAKPAKQASPSPTTQGSAGSGAAGGASASSAPKEYVREIHLQTLLKILMDAHSSTQQLAMALAQRGQDLDQDAENDAQRRALVQDFNVRAEKILATARNRHGAVTEAEYLLAVERHKSNAKVQQLLAFREHLLEAINSNDAHNLPDVPDDLTVEQVLKKLAIFVKHVEQNLRDAVTAAKATKKTGEALAQEITNLVLQNSKKAQARAIEEMGMTEMMFQACIKKYSKHPDVVALFADLNERNSRIMAEVPSITDDMV